jgi:CshA-type fibril repeat protein
MNIINILPVQSINKLVGTLAIFALALLSSSYISGVRAGGEGDPCYDNIPNAYFSLSPGNKALGTLNVTLDGSNSVACKTPIVNYQWDLGDGTAATGSSVTHQYQVGEFTPQLTITDEEGLTNTFSYYVPVIVKADNQDPVLTGESLEILQGENTVIDVSANGSDPDGDDITYNYFLPGDEQYGSSFNTDKGYVYVSSSAGQYTYYAHDGESGMDSFEIGVSDGFGGVGIATVNINILAIINAVEDNASTVDGTPVTIDVLANDYSYNDESYEIYWNSGSYNGGVTVNEDQTITFRPNSGFTGSTYFEYGIKSTVPNTWRVSTAYVYVEVTPAPNQAPNANDDNLILNEDFSASVNVTANDSDPDGDSFTASLAGGPTNGSATLNANGTLSYTPNANYNGNDSVTYQLTDEEENVSQVATVAITVNSVNDLPKAGNESVILEEDSNVPVNVLANDRDLEDGSNLTVAITGAPRNGSGHVNSDGSITYTPNANYNGSDELTYSVSDSNGGSATATVYFSVSSVNDGPTAAFNFSVSNGGWVTFNAASSADIDGEIVNYAWNFGDGTSASSRSNSINHKYKGNNSRTVTLTLTDNEGATATYTRLVEL